MLIGNDIVDLDDPECQPGNQHVRFNARVFSLEEQRRIASDEDEHCMRWVLWAAKEAAFKALKREHPMLCFSPMMFRVVWPSGAAAGVTSWGGMRLRAFASWGPGYVHVVTVGPATRWWGAAAACPVGDCPSVAVRRLAASVLSPAQPGAVDFGQVGRAPHAYGGACIGRQPVSLSHHGRFVAAAGPVPVP